MIASTWMLAASAVVAAIQATDPPGPRLPDVVVPPPVPFTFQGEMRPLIEPKPSLEGAPEKVPVRISGIVRDLKGRPVAGATVWAVGTRILDVPEPRERSAAAGSTTTGADGRYLFEAAEVPTSRLRDSPGAATPFVQFRVVARAPGTGVGWHRETSMYALPLKDPDDYQGRLGLNTPSTMDLYLRPEADLKGRVIDEAGRPVVGVRARVADINLLDEQGSETSFHLGLDSKADDPLPDGLGRAVTDAEGRFRLPGLPSESCCWVLLDRPGTRAEYTLYASTAADAEGVHPDPYPQHNGRLRHGFSPAEMTVTMGTPRRLDVRVVASDDGRPVPGVHVGSMGETSWKGPFSGDVTDAEGKAALDLPAGRYQYLAGYAVSADSRFLVTHLRPLVVAPEPAVQTLELAMKAGAEVMLEVVDAGTGLGVPDVHFEIKPGRQGLDWERVQRSNRHFGTVGAPTDADGKLRVVLDPLPGLAYRVRVAGLDPLAAQVPGVPAEALPYEADKAVSDPFEPRPGVPVPLRFVLRKK